MQVAHSCEATHVWDLGCGNGAVLLDAAVSLGLMGYGVDLDAELLDRARESARQVREISQISGAAGLLPRVPPNQPSAVMLAISLSGSLMPPANDAGRGFGPGRGEGRTQHPGKSL